MIVLGIILLILGYVLPVPILFTIGWILIVIGIILWILPSVGGGRYGVRGPVGGRWY